MASGDSPTIPKDNMTFARSKVPILGAFIDYLTTNIEYLRSHSFTPGERLQATVSKHALSATFIAFVCFSLGLASNVKFEVVTFDEEPLPNDLHLVLMSKNDKLYIDDIDTSRVMWCIEASDAIVIAFSTLLIWNAGNVRSPLSEYLYLPWLGATIRGLLLRQAPTAGALLYTMAVVNGNVNPLFLTAFSFLFLLEARLWLEISRLVALRWQRRDHIDLTRPSQNEVETLWSNDDVQSLERSPLSEYLYLPWLGATIRGLLLRQAPTAGALLYTMAVVNGNVNPLFLTAFSFLFLLEARLWLEISRLVALRWQRRDHIDLTRPSQNEVETLWSNDDVQSLEVSNYVY